jgi:hypothetical protein
MADQQTSRPYGGTWRPNRRGLVQYTPDCLVFINGDIELSTMQATRKKVPLQPFITQVSVDSSIEAGGASASISMSIPMNFASEYFREGESVLMPGLEVHIYMRGFHPVPGVASMETDPATAAELAGIVKELGADPKKLAVRPWYHCFHGVTISSTHSYSGGMYEAGLECAGMLHFWQFMDMSTNASLFGSRPKGSQLKMSLVGHNYTNMSPFSIIYSLYRDTAGAAGAVAWALSSSSNTSGMNADGDFSLFEATSLYWQKRFASKMYGLRMFGANGEMFTTAQAAIIGRMSSSQLSRTALAAYKAQSRAKSTPKDPAKAQGQTPARFLAPGQEAVAPKWTVSSATMSAGKAKNTTVTGKDTKVVDMSDTVAQRRASEGSGVAVATHQLKAYVTDISQYGNIQLFESSYESKLDIALAASSACGYEFYQDVDGDLVFKPPLYNLDTSGSTAYRVRPLDVISISFTNSEPSATYCTVKGEAFQNTNGLGLTGEFGVRGQYIDYRLVAKYGWRPGDLDASFYSSGRAAFWAAVVQLDRINSSMHGCSLTIPMRPELRPGFPIYIEHIDCFYYITSMSHTFSFGGQCTTTLVLTSRRRKWVPPGDPNKAGIEGVTLDKPFYPPKPLYTVDPSGQQIVGVGFPNVVMALDPNRTDPLLWAFGADLTNIGNPNTLINMLSLLQEEGLVFKADVSKGDPNSTADFTKADEFDPSALDTLWAVHVDKGKAMSATTYEQYFNNNGTGGSYATGTDSAQSWTSYNGGNDKEPHYFVFTWTELMDQATKYLNDLSSLKTTFDKGVEDSPNSDKYREDYKKAIADLEVEIMQGKDDSTGASAGRASIWHILEMAKAHTQGGENETASFNPRQMSSAGLATLLSDKKASFSNASTPGYYRYYSSSHPDPLHHCHGVSAHTTNNGGVSTLTYKLDGSSEAENSVAEGISDVKDRDLFVLKGQITIPTSLPFLHNSTVTSVTGESTANALARGFVQTVQQQKKKPTDKVYAFHIAGSAGTSTVKLPSHYIKRLEFSKHKLKTYKTVPSTSTHPAIVGWSSLSGTVSNNLLRDGMNDAAELVGDVFDNLVSNMTFIFPKFASKSGHAEWPTASSVALTRNRIPITFGTLGMTSGGEWSVDASNIWDNHMMIRGQVKKKGQTEYGGYTRDGAFKFQTKGASGAFEGSSGKLLSKCPIVRLGASWNTVRRFYYEKEKGKSAVRTTPLGADLTTEQERYVQSDRVFDYACRDFSKELRYRLKAMGAAYAKEFKLRNKGLKKDDASKRSQEADWKVMAELAENINTALGLGGALKIKGLFKQALTGGTKVNFTSPVFPVSDSKGYEHFGSHAYGRGISIEAGGTMEELHKIDVLKELDPAKVEAAVRIILGKSKGSYDDLLKKMAEEILKLDRQSPILHEGATTLPIDWTKWGEATSNEQRINILRNGLAVEFESGSSAPMKIVPSNNAFSLAELLPAGSDDFRQMYSKDASMSVADSFIKLEAFDPDNYVFVGSEGDEESGNARIADWVSSQMVEKSASWAMSQAALRGRKEVEPNLMSWDEALGGYGDYFGDGGALSQATDAIDGAVDDFAVSASNAAATFNNLDEAYAAMGDATFQTEAERKAAFEAAAAAGEPPPGTVDHEDGPGWRTSEEWAADDDDGDGVPNAEDADPEDPGNSPEETE